MVNGGAELIWDHSKGTGRVSTVVAVGTPKMPPLLQTSLRGRRSTRRWLQIPSKRVSGREKVHALISNQWLLFPAWEFH